MTIGSSFDSDPGFISSNRKSPVHRVALRLCVGMPMARSDSSMSGLGSLLSTSRCSDQPDGVRLSVWVQPYAGAHAHGGGRTSVASLRRAASSASNQATSSVRNARDLTL